MNFLIAERQLVLPIGGLLAIALVTSLLCIVWGIITVLSAIRRRGEASSRQKLRIGLALIFLPLPCAFILDVAAMLIYALVHPLITRG